MIGMGRSLNFMAVTILALPIFAAHPELAKDGDFEKDNGSWTLPERGAYRWLPGGGRNGSGALFYSNDDPKLPYRLPSQVIKAEKGKVYCYSAWIRTEELKPVGRNCGASVCVEWQDANGRTIGGCYTVGVRNTSAGWVKIQDVTKPIPKDARTVTLTVYVTPHATGKAWFDDVSVTEFGRETVAGLYSSVYRNRSHAGRVDFRALLSLPKESNPADFKARFRHTTVDGSEKTVCTVPVSREMASCSIDVGDMPLGESRVSFALESSDGKTLGETSLTFERLGTASSRKVEFDRFGRTIVDGKPFFPLGMFISDKQRKETLAEGPFNCVMSYMRPTAADMDWWHARGFKVIYNIKDIFCGTGRSPHRIKTSEDEVVFIKEKVAEIGNHPALLAWYINDEFPVSYLSRMAARRNLMEKLDPEHPTWSVQYQIDQLREYFPTFDVIGTDPYPVASKPLSTAAEWTLKTRDAYFGMRPMWQVPQAFDWAAYHPPEQRKGDRMPTLEEMRSMTWQCIAAGANGLIYYSFTGIQKEWLPTPFEKAWKDICSIAEEVHSRIPMLISEPGPDVMVTEGLLVRTWKKGVDVWLLAVNATDHAIERALPVPFAASVERDFGGDISFDGDNLRIRIGAFAPTLVRLKTK